MDITSHKNLDVWQKSMDFVTEIYSLTKRFPKEEMYGLSSQMRRAAVSIPSNIAEGRAKRTTREFIRFVNISFGSASELETQILIARNLGYVNENEIENTMSHLNEISKMLYKLLVGLEKKLALP